jgi:hypothetical protein
MDKNMDLLPFMNQVVDSIHAPVENPINHPVYNQLARAMDEGTQAKGALTWMSDYGINRSTVPDRTDAFAQEATPYMPRGDLVMQPTEPIQSYIPLLLIGGGLLYLFIYRR